MRTRPPGGILLLLAGSSVFAACDDATAPQTPAFLRIRSGDEQATIAGSDVPDQLVVWVGDSAARGIPGKVVTFAVASGDGSVGDPLQPTDDNGLATLERWTLGVSAGTNTLLAATSGLPSVTFTATGIAGPPAILTKNQGDNQTERVNSTLPSSPAALVTDIQGKGTPPPMSQ